MQVIEIIKGSYLIGTCGRKDSVLLKSVGVHDDRATGGDDNAFDDDGGCALRIGCVWESSSSNIFSGADQRRLRETDASSGCVWEG